MKIRYENNTKQGVRKNIKDIPCDTVFGGTIFNIVGVFWRTLDHIVNLQEPQQYWRVDGFRGLMVNDYKKLDASLVIRGESKPSKLGFSLDALAYTMEGLLGGNVDTRKK